MGDLPMGLYRGNYEVQFCGYFNSTWGGNELEFEMFISGDAVGEQWRMSPVKTVKLKKLEDECFKTDLGLYFVYGTGIYKMDSTDTPKLIISFENLAQNSFYDDLYIALREVNVKPGCRMALPPWTIIGIVFIVLTVVVLAATGALLARCLMKGSSQVKQIS